ncbi:MAG TPA: VOC family protein [Thermoanaerobaculia bacterium]|nr:VOC family protein [Thermoanaerobaculia bacterium]
MAERKLLERLDDAIGAILAGRREGLALADPALATLLVIAADLRDLPDPAFKARLRKQLIPPSQAETMEEQSMSATAVVETKPEIPSIMPYHLVEGASDFIAFLVEAFEGKERFRVPRPDGLIMHAEVSVGDSIIELADATSEYKRGPMATHLYVDGADAAYQRAVAAGATTLREPMDQPYGDREATVRDRWGNTWHIATHQEDVAEVELMRRFAGQWPAEAPRKQPGVGPRPKGFHTVTPYLHVHGAARMIEFLAEAFKAAELGERTVGPDGTIMHAEVRIGDSVIELGEARDEWQPMEGAYHLHVDDVDRVHERSLHAGAIAIAPPEDKPYGERASHVKDPFGNSWFIATMK